MSSSHDLYLANRELIERAIQYACRRHHLHTADAQDFASIVRLHLLENDFAVLRAFRGHSSLQTYLVTVFTNRLLDWRNARWGKWRPSAEARRIGPVAVHLETLIHRDGLSLEEACETLRTTHDAAPDTDELLAIAARLPRRVRRTFLSDGGLDRRPSPNGQADAGIAREEAAQAARTAARALEQHRRQLPAQDRLILKMRFDDGFAVADIARALNLDQKPLYRRISRLLSDLRKALEEAGITAAVAADVLDLNAFDRLDEHAGQEIGNPVRPFNHGSGSRPAQDSRVP